MQQGDIQSVYVTEDGSVGISITHTAKVTRIGGEKITFAEMHPDEAQKWGEALIRWAAKVRETQ